MRGHVVWTLVIVQVVGIDRQSARMVLAVLFPFVWIVYLMQHRKAQTHTFWGKGEEACFFVFMLFFFEVPCSSIWFQMWNASLFQEARGFFSMIAESKHQPGRERKSLAWRLSFSSSLFLFSTRSLVCGWFLLYFPLCKSKVEQNVNRLIASEWRIKHLTVLRQEDALHVSRALFKCRFVLAGKPRRVHFKHQRGLKVIWGSEDPLILKSNFAFI